MVRHKENCYTAELLYSNYTDDKNKVYLTYIYQILNEVQRTNKGFESESVDPTKLLQDLKNLMKSITAKIVIPSARIEIYTDNIEQHFDPNPYLGYAYENALRDASNITEQERRVLKDRCIQFTVKLCKELQMRLPSNLTLLELTHLLHCSEALKIKQHKRSITDLAKQFLTDPKIITDVESQWYNLANVKWENANSSEKLWNEIYRYQDSCGENAFKDLAELALTVLSLPYSNAEVERVFSQMNAVKSESRNRLKVKTINATLTVRYGLKRIGKCCNSYTLPQDVIDVIGTLRAYDATYSASTVNNSENNELGVEEECLMV